MSAPLLAEFDSPEALVRAMRLAAADGHRALDVFTPFPVPDLTDAFAPKRNPVRPVMALAGFGSAASAGPGQTAAARSVAVRRRDTGEDPPRERGGGLRSTIRRRGRVRKARPRGDLV